LGSLDYATEGATLQVSTKNGITSHVSDQRKKSLDKKIYYGIYYIYQSV